MPDEEPKETKVDEAKPAVKKAKKLVPATPTIRKVATKAAAPKPAAKAPAKPAPKPAAKPAAKPEVKKPAPRKVEAKAPAKEERKPVEKEPAPRPAPAKKEPAEKPKARKVPAKKPAAKKVEKPAKKEKEEEEAEEEEEHVARQKPELTKAIRASLKLRREIASRRPRFLRQEWYRHPRLGLKWRKPQGMQSKLRRHLGYRINVVSIGFRSPRPTRDLHPSGFQEVLVHTPNQLKGIDPKRQAVRIAGSVGGRKREQIEKEAEEIGVRVLNPREE